MKIIIIKEERMHTCIVMGFRHLYIEISFTPTKIYRVIYILVEFHLKYNSFKSY